MAIDTPAVASSSCPGQSACGPPSSRQRNARFSVLVNGGAFGGRRAAELQIKLSVALHCWAVKTSRAPMRRGSKRGRNASGSLRICAIGFPGRGRHAVPRRPCVSPGCRRHCARAPRGHRRRQHGAVPEDLAPGLAQARRFLERPRPSPRTFPGGKAGRSRSRPRGRHHAIHGAGDPSQRPYAGGCRRARRDDRLLAPARIHPAGQSAIARSSTRS